MCSTVKKARLILLKTKTHPLNHYGESKLAGEKAVLDTLPEQSLVVRTSWLFGPGQKNFVPFIVTTLHTQTPVRVVDNQWGNTDLDREPRKNAAYGPGGASDRHCSWMLQRSRQPVRTGAIFMPLPRGFCGLINAGCK